MSVGNINDFDPAELPVARIVSDGTTTGRDPEPLPPAPTQIMGLPPDTWALGIERKIDAVFTAQHEALLALAENNRAAREEVRSGFERISESLKVIERHELAIQGQQKQLDEQRRLLFAHGDRQNEIVERQEQLAAEQQSLERRVAALEAKPSTKPATKRRKAQRK